MRTTSLFALVALLASCNRSGGDRSTMQSGAGGEPAAAAGAGTSAPQASGPRVVLRPDGHDPVTVDVEVQRTPEARERGLMFRRELDELHGMIFLFPAPEHQVFWMHNTYLPLDMVFITSDRRVLGVVKNATPMTDDPRSVPGDAALSQYVLEVRAGFADRHHIEPGTRVDFVSIPPVTE